MVHTVNVSHGRYVQMVSMDDFDTSGTVEDAMAYMVQRWAPSHIAPTLVNVQLLVEDRLVFDGGDPWWMLEEVVSKHHLGEPLRVKIRGCSGRRAAGGKSIVVSLVGFPDKKRVVTFPEDMMGGVMRSKWIMVVLATFPELNYRSTPGGIPPYALFLGGREIQDCNAVGILGEGAGGECMTLGTIDGSPIPKAAVAAMRDGIIAGHNPATHQLLPVNKVRQPTATDDEKYYAAKFKILNAAGAAMHRLDNSYTVRTKRSPPDLKTLMEMKQISLRVSGYEMKPLLPTETEQDMEWKREDVKARARARAQISREKAKLRSQSQPQLQSQPQYKRQPQPPRRLGVKQLNTLHASQNGLIWENLGQVSQQGSVPRQNGHGGGATPMDMSVYGAPYDCNTPMNWDNRMPAQHQPLQPQPPQHFYDEDEDMIMETGEVMNLLEEWVSENNMEGALGDIFM